MLEWTSYAFTYKDPRVAAGKYSRNFDGAIIVQK